MKAISLRLRLVLWTVTLEALLLLTFAFILVSVLQNTQHQQLDDTLRLSAAQINAAVDLSIDQQTWPDQLSLDEIPSLREHGILFWLLLPDGTLAERLGNTAHLPLPTLLPASGTSLDQPLVDGNLVRLFVSPLREGEEFLGTAVLAIPLLDHQTFLNQVMLSLALALPVVLLFSALGGLFLAGRALAPVASMTLTARRISAADLSQRLDPNLPNDEIGRLAHTFNAMLERLDQAFQRERQLTSDVSHELRTPLAMLKTQVSLARSRTRSRDELLRMINDMEGDVDRMSRLVEQLLTLARIEQHGLDRFSEVDLRELLGRVTDKLRPDAAARSVRLTLQLPPEAILLQGDEDRLYQVFANLIQNAIKYADPDSTIWVGVQRRGDRVQIAVSNQGVGIAAEHLPLIFERFYRADDSRARSTGGFGLGLAISKAIIEAHHGQISVTSTPMQATVFTVSLPVG